VIEGHAETSVGGPVPYPPAGTTASFQTCVTPSGSDIRVFWADTVDRCPRPPPAPDDDLSPTPDAGTNCDAHASRHRTPTTYADAASTPTP